MTCVVVGAGEAGVHAALSVRAHGYDGNLVMIGDELHPPYTRPPLSKAVLTAERPGLPQIRSPGELEEKGIELRLGTAVSTIDREQKRVILGDRSSVPYSSLILATGCRPRRLSGALDSPRVLHLRTFDDALAIRSRFMNGARVVLIGGGYIGLEIAASANRLGCQVTVLEVAPTIMARVAGPVVSKYLSSVHEAHGVRIRTATKLVAIREADGHLSIALGGGESLTADFVIVGIGAEPRIELAERAGLDLGNGVVVDEFGRTSDPNIFACGDIAEHPNPVLGRRIRLESWQNAQQQATVVGAAVADASPKPYAMVPWFWSDQFEVNLQMVGLPWQWDDEVVRGHPGEGSFTAIYLYKGTVVGGATVNRPKDIPPIRAAIKKALIPSRSHLIDQTVGLENALKAATRRIQDVA